MEDKIYLNPARYTTYKRGKQTFSFLKKLT